MTNPSYIFHHIGREIESRLSLRGNQEISLLNENEQTFADALFLVNPPQNNPFSLCALSDVPTDELLRKHDNLDGWYVVTKQADLLVGFITTEFVPELKLTIGAFPTCKTLYNIPKDTFVFAIGNSYMLPTICVCYYKIAINTNKVKPIFGFLRRDLRIALSQQKGYFKNREGFNEMISYGNVIAKCDKQSEEKEKENHWIHLSL